MAWVEVTGTFIRFIQRTRIIPLDLAYGMEFRVAAWGSRKYLKNADVLLVRSGAGQSGAIQKARKNGMAIVTDPLRPPSDSPHRRISTRDKWLRKISPSQKESRVVTCR